MIPDEYQETPSSVGSVRALKAPAYNKKSQRIEDAEKTQRDHFVPTHFWALKSKTLERTVSPNSGSTKPPGTNHNHVPNIYLERQENARGASFKKTSPWPAANQRVQQKPQPLPLTRIPRLLPKGFEAKGLSPCQ